MTKQRLDSLLVELGLAVSRQQAQRLIRAGAVTVNRRIADKPGVEINTTAQVEVKSRSRYVSRGGEKLAKALEVFPIDVAGRICIDGGISTGGFTDCLLQAGAKQVYGVDVGYGQVAWKLRTDPRVVLKERTNLRFVKPEDLFSSGQPYPDLAVVDISFISLTKVLPALWNLLQAPREAVLLIKPQFEVGRERVGKRGVVKDTQAQAEAILQVLKVALALDWNYGEVTWSPLLGPAGNIEYLLWLQMDTKKLAPSLEEIQQITQAAQEKLLQKLG